MAHVPRIYRPGHLGPGPLTLGGDDARRLLTVMRIRTGDEVRLFAGDGKEWQAAVRSTGRDLVALEVTALARQEPPAAVVLHVWCGLVRPNRLEWAIEKCTEAGADVIRPAVSEHSARGDSASASRLERWRRLTIEAAEQSGRLYVPVIEPPAPFADLLKTPRTPVIVADATGEPLERLRPLLPVAGNLAVAVGPEGGWSPDELSRFRAAGALLLRLGPHTLRTETAAVVATALLRSTLL